MEDFSLHAKDASIKASSDTQGHETAHTDVSIDIPIAGYIPLTASASGQTVAKDARMYHADNRITATGKLEIDLEGDGKVSGVRLQGAKVTVRAKNLVLESIQDVIEKRMEGMSVSIGLAGGNLPGLGAEVQGGKRDAAWTNAIGSIIGTEVTKVVVQQTLELAGGLIANAELDKHGRLTDKGNMSIKAGSIIARHLHDYDDGVSFGVGIALSKTMDAKGNSHWGTNIPVSYSFDESRRDILPVIGAGSLEVETLTGELSRDLASHIGETTGDKASMKAEIPVSDIVEFVKKAIDSNKPALGVAAGDLAEEDDEEERKEVSSNIVIQNELKDYKGDTKDFYHALGDRESTGNQLAVNKYGFAGLYQMGKPALIDVEYYDKAKGWTGKNGIYSEKDFLSNAAIQKVAAMEYHQLMWNDPRYLKKYQHYEGKIISGIKLTKSGMIAAAHLIGASALRKFLKTNGEFIPRDKFGTPCTEYLELFGGYKLNF